MYLNLVRKSFANLFDFAGFPQAKCRECAKDGWRAKERGGGQGKGQLSTMSVSLPAV